MKKLRLIAIVLQIAFYVLAIAKLLTSQANPLLERGLIIVQAHSSIKGVKMSIEFVMLIILAGWVGVNEWRLHIVEKRIKDLEKKDK